MKKKVILKKSSSEKPPVKTGAEPAQKKRKKPAVKKIPKKKVQKKPAKKKTAKRKATLKKPPKKKNVSRETQEKKDDGLTDKERMFCFEYLIDLNKTQAAIRAGYSPKSAGEIGYENMKKPEIQKEIQRLMDERVKRVEISSDEIISNIKYIGECCMARVPVLVRQGRKFVQKKVLDEETGEWVGVWQFKEMGALKAQELLGKHKKLFVETKEETVRERKIFITPEEQTEADKHIFDTIGQQ